MNKAICDMRTILSFVIVFLNSFYVNASTNTAQQNPADTIRRFYDESHKPTTADHAAYISAVVYKDSSWFESQYYASSQTLRLFGKYRDSLCAIPIDSFYYFHSDGSLEAVGKYADGQKEGVWLKFHSNKMMADSTTYEKGHPVHNTLSWNAGGWMTDSIAWFDNFGSGVEWSGEGHFVAAGQYNLNRERHGLWKFYFPNGKISTSEVYQNDSLLSIKSFDQNGNPIPNEGPLTRLEIESTYPGGLPGWSRYLLRSLNYPCMHKKMIYRE